MVLFTVGVDRSLSAFLYSLTYFTLQSVSPCFGVLLFLKRTRGISLAHACSQHERSA
jgi:hypothetical protein